MMLVKTYLAPSPIEGMGVFAGEFIRSGTLLWALNPKFDIFVRPEEMDGLAPHMRDFVHRYAYPHLEQPGTVVVDCDHGKFMNHSDTPNTDFTIFDKGFALVDIAEGQEITCDYHEFDPSFRGFTPSTVRRVGGRQAPGQRVPHAIAGNGGAPVRMRGRSIRHAR